MVHEIKQGRPTDGNKIGIWTVLLQTHKKMPNVKLSVKTFTNKRSRQA